MKTQHKRTVVAIDDDEINLTILTKCASSAGFSVQAFDSGYAGWEHLRNHANEVDIVLLDKMMPDMSGIDLLRKIKLDKEIQHLPVIMQTGDVGISQMREGLENGAYYYLTKPFHPEILTAILHSAAKECTMRENLLNQMSESQNRFVGLMQAGVFQVRTHQEANLLAAALSQASLYPEFVAVGLMELLTNAIEHGNLAFGFESKQQSMLNNTWSADLLARQISAEYSQCKVQVTTMRSNGTMHIIIKDDGQGFDWQRYIYSDTPGNLADPNGRGISKARVMLDDMQYIGSGNEVQCNIVLSPMN